MIGTTQSIYGCSNVSNSAQSLRRHGRSFIWKVALLVFGGRMQPPSISALEPEVNYELRLDGTGGCEDPHITFVEPLRRYVMTYTAHSPNGPRIALAISEDLFRWQRLGLATFRPYQGIEFEGVDNKDASVFPVAVPDPSGQLSMAILQRPLFPGTRPEETARHPASGLVDIHRESIWISYCSTAMADCEPFHLSHFGSHHRLAAPVAAWEQLKIGGSTPPILTRHGWLTIYHGVSELSASLGSPRKLCYSAGVLVLSEELPQVIRYRSREPVLTPELPQEREELVANVVLPTSIDRRDDRVTRSLRRLLWDGRQPDRRGETRRAETPAVR